MTKEYYTAMFGPISDQLSNLSFNISIYDVESDIMYCLNHVVDRLNEDNNYTIAFDPKCLHTVFDHPDEYYCTNEADLKTIVTFMVNNPDVYTTSYSQETENYTFDLAD